MSKELGYDEQVRHSTSASIARCRWVFLPLSFFSFHSVSFRSASFFSSLIVVCVSMVSMGLAQNGGAGSGGGGHAGGGGGGSAGASFSGSHVAGGSAGFGFSGSHGSGSNTSSSNHGTSHSNPAGNSNGNYHHHPHYSGGGYAGPVFYAVPYPYIADDSGAYDDSTDADAGTADTDDSDADYQGGPTVFDRRGSGAESYIPPVEDDSQTRRREPIPRMKLLSSRRCWSLKMGIRSRWAIMRSSA
jgi:hypothetical protein